MDKMFHQPSVMTAQQHFSHTPKAEIERSRFDRSHGLKTTFDENFLVPIFVDEVLPGDTFHLNETSFTRMATPLRPVMDNIYFETFYFFVPYRLLWDNWTVLMGERKTPTSDPTLVSVPQVTIDLAAQTSGYLSNYMGVPLGTTGTIKVSALPFRAYALIFNEWFRDENLVAPMPFTTGDGPDTTTNTIFMNKRGKRHDYFTSALPWPQKGDPVVIPVGPIVGTGTPTWSGAAGSSNWVDPNLEVQLDPTLGAATINDLRNAFQIQKLLERDARGGTRYIELILAHFGVQSPDARLQRPEYLGGGSTRININPVAAAYGNSTTEIALGDLAGYATGINRGGWSKSFTEHGIIIGLANVRADLTYQNGLERFWKRQTRLDFYWPAFAHLGEQAIANSEIFVSGVELTDNLFWGYQERSAEYRYKPSRITGKFQSGDPQSLDVWHLGQDYTALPVLNDSFITDDTPIDRIVAVPSEPHFLCDIWFNLNCERPMPVYTVPGYVDHF